MVIQWCHCQSESEKKEESNGLKGQLPVSMPLRNSLRAPNWKIGSTQISSSRVLLSLETNGGTKYISLLGGSMIHEFSSIYGSQHTHVGLRLESGIAVGDLGTTQAESAVQFRPRIFVAITSRL